jgi:hypothetical protein
MRARGASVFHVRGNKVTRLVVYDDAERALADLGLLSQVDSARALVPLSHRAMRSSAQEVGAVEFATHD